MRIAALLTLVLPVIFSASLAASPANEIRFEKPGSDSINDSLPLGNGRLGVLIPGQVHRERISLDEDSVWSGWVNRSANNPAAASALPAIRELMWQGKMQAAQDLVNRTQVPNKTDQFGHSLWDAYGSFQMLAFLDLEFSHPEGAVSHYYRRLDLDKAVVEIGYTIGDVEFRREFFASYPDQVVVARFSANRKGQISLIAGLSRPDTPASVTEAGGGLLLTGHMPGGGKDPGLEYVARLGIRASSGSSDIEGSRIDVRNADEVVLVLSAASNYLGARAWPVKLGGDPLGQSAQQLRDAMNKDWETLLGRHLEDYRDLYRRVSLDLGADDSERTVSMPTPERLASLISGKPDPGLVELYFNFGRYLLISSSRPGAMAANLQGLWATATRDPKTGRYDYMTPWNGDYHSNINLQMNYWPADVTALPECFEPLDDLIHGMAAAGAETARIQHGAGGWTLHTLYNPWGYTAPGEVASWGHFPMAGAWISRRLWDHYEFTQDRAFLARAWPLLRGSAEFVLDWLVTDPESGLLVSGPAASPENSFLLPDGQTAWFSMGPAMDQSIARDLLTNVLSAAAELDIHDPVMARVKLALPRLAPLRIGSDGRILEWAKPWPEAEPGHRHISHLYALHPGTEITPSGTPELAQAARKTIEYRLAHGGGHTGWSRAWIINFFARLGDGAAAYDNLLALLRTSTLPNLFDTHPPFQIDGNFGATAGIAEMLLQSHVQAGDGSYVIDLLPALPPQWPDGKVTGLRARGGFLIDMEWRNGKLLEAKARSLVGRPLHFRWNTLRFDHVTHNGETIVWDARKAGPEPVAD